MRWRTSAWAGPFKWFGIGILLLFAAILIVMFTDDSLQGAELWMGAALIVACSLLIISMHNWLTIGNNAVKVGYFPFYRRSIPYREIASVSLIDINPLGQFGGWGVKGLAKSPHGLLLGGYPPQGVRIETHDGRRYVSTFRYPGPIISALQARGCKLAAG